MCRKASRRPDTAAQPSARSKGTHRTRTPRGVHSPDILLSPVGPHDSRSRDSAWAVLLFQRATIEHQCGLTELGELCEDCFTRVGEPLMNVADRMTAGQVAERLAIGTSEPASFFARQIRTWAPAGLFGDLARGGDGPTAPIYFDQYHLALARIFSALTRMGLDVRSLVKLKHCGLDTADRPIGRAFRSGIWHVVDEYLSGNRQWFLVVPTTESGEIYGGRYTTNPYRDPDVNIALSSLKPIELTINLEVLWRGLFDRPEGIA